MGNKIFNFQFSIFNSERGLPAIGFAFRRWQAGQALLIVVLIMVVGLTVGLAVVSRSITNVRISTEEENSQRAFSAAEAGLERIIKQGCIAPTPPGTGECISIAEPFGSNVNSRFDTTITTRKGNEILLNGGNPIPRDEGVDIWLVPHNLPPDNSPNYNNPWTSDLTIHWGTQGVSDCNTAALEIVIISGTSALPKSTRYVYDPCSLRQATNNFTSVLETIESVEGRNFPYKSVTFNMSAGILANGLIARVIPIYNSTVVGIKSISTLPSQGFKIDSKGISGQTIRKINYYQGYPSLPVEFFPYIQFSTRQN